MNISCKDINNQQTIESLKEKAKYKPMTREELLMSDEEKQERRNKELVEMEKKLSMQDSMIDQRGKKFFYHAIVFPEEVPFLASD